MPSDHTMFDMPNEPRPRVVRPPTTQAEHTPELKPCPWCGAKAKLSSMKAGNEDAYAIHTDCCCVKLLDVFHGEANPLVKRWNTRVEDKHLRGLNPEAIPAWREACNWMEVMVAQKRVWDVLSEKDRNCYKDFAAALAAVKEVQADGTQTKTGQ